MSSNRVLAAARFLDAWSFAPASPIQWLRHLGSSHGQRVRAWMERSLQRDELSELDPRMLRDIGVTEEQAGRESRRPFWQE